MPALVLEAGLWNPPEQPAVQEPADSAMPMDIDVSQLNFMLSTPDGPLHCSQKAGQQHVRI